MERINQLLSEQGLTIDQLKDKTKRKITAYDKELNGKGIGIIKKDGTRTDVSAQRLTDLFDDITDEIADRAIELEEEKGDAENKAILAEAKRKADEDALKNNPPADEPKESKGFWHWLNSND